VSRLTFIRPLSPSAAVRPPKGDDWLHEPKWDGFMFQDHGRSVRQAPDISGNPRWRVDLIDPRGAAHFYRLMAQMRTSEPDESQLMFLAFGVTTTAQSARLFPLGGFHRPRHSGRRGGHPA